jgi:hypothetical protein
MALEPNDFIMAKLMLEVTKKIDQTVKVSIIGQTGITTKGRFQTG